jgi:hypothetical protein
MDKKTALVKYLLDVIQAMEKERNRRVTYTQFADVVDLPIKTVAVMFDADDPRIPSRKNAQAVAIGLNSNRINIILGYPEVDPQFISFMRTYRELKPEQRGALIRQMKGMVEPNAEAVPV